MSELSWKNVEKLLNPNKGERIEMDSRDLGCDVVRKSVTNSIQPFSINILATQSTNWSIVYNVGIPLKYEMNDTHYHGQIIPYLLIYSMAHEKPASRLVARRGRRSQTLCRKLKKCKCKVLTGYRRCWKWSPCTSMHFCARCSILSYTRCNSAVSIRRIDTAELHRIASILFTKWCTKELL